MSYNSDDSDQGYSCGCFPLLILLSLVSSCDNDKPSADLSDYLSQFFSLLWEWLLIALSYGFKIVVVVAVIVSIVFLIRVVVNITRHKELQKKAEESKKQSDFGTAYPEVLKRYFSVIACIQRKGGKVEVYKRNIEDIYSRSIELHYETKKLKDEADKYKAIAIDLKNSLSLSKNEEKNLVTANNLQRIESRLENYEKYIQEVDLAIKETSQDFVNIESELLLSESNDSKSIEAIEACLKSLEEKSKTLAYIQNHMPVFD